MIFCPRPGEKLVWLRRRGDKSKINTFYQVMMLDIDDLDLDLELDGSDISHLLLKLGLELELKVSVFCSTTRRGP
jgi:hypothetical protein